MTDYALLRKRLSTALHMLATRYGHRGNIAMLHHGRCGSSVLGDLIRQHPNVYWDSEVFQDVFRDRLWEARLIKDPMWLLRVRMLRAGRRYYGFKSKCHPAYHPETVFKMDPARYVRDLEKLGYEYFIVLKRQNYLRQQISEEVGRQRGRTWHRSAGTKPSLHPVTLDVSCIRFGGERIPLLASFESRDENYALLERLLGERALWLTYEADVLPGPRHGYRRVCEYLNLPPQGVTIKRGRTNPFPVPDMLQNFSEVEAALRGTPYAWMLYD